MNQTRLTNTTAPDPLPAICQVATSLKVQGNGQARAHLTILLNADSKHRLLKQRLKDRACG